MTVVDVWAPAFDHLLDRVTVENSQVVFATGPWCRLCESHLLHLGKGDRVAHARAHDKALRQWRKERASARRREQRQTLRLLARERRLTSRVIGGAS